MDIAAYFFRQVGGLPWWRTVNLRNSIFIMFRSIRRALAHFGKLERPIFFLIGAVFCIQLIDSSFFILFNYYLKNLNYSDEQIAQLISYRYVSVMVLSFPLGLFIKGRELRPFFRVAAIAVPFIALGVLEAIDHRLDGIAKIGMVLLGASVILLQVTVLPFMVLNVPKERHSEAFSLYFQMSSITAFVVGISHYFLNGYSSAFFTEKRVLQLFAILGFASIYFVSKIKIREQISERVALRDLWHAYDWGKILRVMTPTFMIAIGAGLTIPFVNLFFSNVHGLDSRDYSLVGSSSFLLVALMLLFIPTIKRRFGYGVAIVLFQSLAVLALIVMATTQYYAHLSGAAAVAIIAFLLRQPLMNVAGPATSELSLSYVGERNQEIIGALNATVWSGSWFVSSQIFGYLRSIELPYVTIFLFTAGLYTLAVLWYVALIQQHERQHQEAAS